MHNAGACEHGRGEDMVVAQRAWNRRQAMAQQGIGILKDTLGCGSVAFLCPQHETLLSAPIPCTMCQTRPAELPVKCMDLCHF